MVPGDSTTCGIYDLWFSVFGGGRHVEGRNTHFWIHGLIKWLVNESTPILENNAWFWLNFGNLIGLGLHIAIVCVGNEMVCSCSSDEIIVNPSATFLRARGFYSPPYILFSYPWSSLSHPLLLIGPHCEHIRGGRDSCKSRLIKDEVVKYNSKIPSGWDSQLKVGDTWEISCQRWGNPGWYRVMFYLYTGMIVTFASYQP